MPEPAICLVTGATSGLGYAMAFNMAQRGAHVIAVGRNQASLDDLADAIDGTKGSVTMVPMDITDDNAISYLAQSIYERWHRLDIWVHTAWFTAPMQPTPHMIAKDLDKAFNTNIRATARLIAVLEPILRNTKHAQAVFFDDRTHHGPHMSNVGMSKSAQIEIARNWQAESKRIGPRVIIETPAPMKGQLRATLYPGEDSAKLALPANEAQRILDMLTVI